MPRIFFYKLTTDNGGAPCVKHGLLSLAICKPQIRTNASEDDLIFGFAADSLSRDNRLIYAARVTETVGRSYYTDQRFSSRGDRIYRWVAGAYHWRANAKHHGPHDLQRDLGRHPDYEKAHVLLSADFRYLGSKGTADYKKQYRRIKGAVEGLGRGHRVHLTDDLRAEFLDLKDRLWGNFQMKTVGPPTSQPNRSVCHRTQSVGIIEP